MKKLDKEEFLTRSKLVQSKEWDYSQVDYVNTHTPIIIVCPDHGPWKTTPKMHMLGQGCNICSTARAAKLTTSTTEDFIPKVINVHGDTYDLSKVSYEKHDKLVEVVCRTHGSFFLTPNKLLNGRGCQKCSKLNKKESLLKQAKDIFVTNCDAKTDKYDYSLVNYVNAKTKVEIICKAGHPNFFQSPDVHLVSGCPSCAKTGFQPNSPGIIYVMSDGELTKVGITNYSLDKRLNQIRRSSGRNFKVLTFISFSDGRVPDKVETELLAKYRNSHTQPQDKFDGYSECFYDLGHADIIHDVVQASAKYLTQQPN